MDYEIARLVEKEGHSVSGDPRNGTGKEDVIQNVPTTAIVEIIVKMILSLSTYSAEPQNRTLYLNIR